MKKIPLIVLLLVNVVFAKDILLLHSYHQGYGWSDSITKAIIDNFENSDIDITIEYMDTKNIYTKRYEASLFKFYKDKYKNRTFDLIIASDNNALNFLETYNQKLFAKTPIIFCGINNFDMKTFQKTSIFSRATGVIESVDIKKNIELIIKLHPKLSKLLVINDTTTTGLEIQKEFVKILPEYQNSLDIEYIDKFDISNLKQKVKNLPKNSVILFMLLFKDETGKVFTFKEGLETIKHASNVPIYGLWDFYIKYGLVGGYLTHGYEQGKYASLLAKEYFKKHNISKIKPILQSPNRYIFEYKELQKFNIDINALPKDSIILNEPFSFYETYKIQIYLVLVVFVVFVIIIILLYLSLQEKKLAKNQLNTQFNFIQTLLNTLENPIFYKNKDGKYIGCNDAFCNFIGKSKDEIIGKTMYDFFSDQKEFLQTHEDIEQKLFNNEKVDEYILNYNLNGDIKTIIIHKSLFYDSNKELNGILTILHDITYLAKIEDEKKQNESFLAQQSKLAEIGEMINAIAHQWNEPLVEISAIVQDLQMQYQESNLTNNDIDQFVNDSMVQIQYMSKTLKDFRDFLKPSVKKSNFHLKDAFVEVLNILERQIKYSYIDLNIKYNTDDLIVYGYKNEFIQVLITIINNAKDAILKVKSDDKRYKGIISIDVSSHQQHTILEISDNGCGIRQKDKEDIFKPYFSTKPKGNGLGLYMSKFLIEDKMDGKIYFKKSEHLTTLCIELPKKKG